MSIRAVLFLGMVLVAAPARADVLVVDDTAGPGVDHLSIQEAIAAALDHDVVLIRDGVFQHFVLDGKSLALTADTGAAVTVLGPSAIRNVPPGGFTSLAGVRLEAAGGSADPALTVQDCAGSIWLERCTLVGGPGSFGGGFETEATYGLSVSACASVMGRELIVIGGSEGGSSFGARDAILAEDSLLTLFDSVCSGGLDGCGALNPALCTGVSGSGAGLRVRGGLVLVEGSTLTGGKGPCVTMTSFPFLTFCMSGADGITVQDGGQLIVFDVTSTGGFGWPEGLPVNLVDGTLTDWPGAAPGLTISSPLREGQVGTLGFSGQAGDEVWLLWSLAADSLPVPKYQGFLLAGPLLLAAPVGTLGGSGSLELLPVVPSLGPGVEGIGLVLQAAFVPASGPPVLAQATRPILLDGSL